MASSKRETSASRGMAAQPGATRRIVFGRAAAVAGGALALAACGPLPGQGSQGAGGPKKEPVTLRTTWQAQTAEHTMAQRAPAFEQRFPHVKVQFEPSSEYLTKLGVLFSSNTVGDVMFLESDDEGFFGFWAAQGVLAQLDPFIRRDRYDLNVFFARAVDALKIVDGKIWAFPYNAFMGRCGLFYNSGMFQQAGVPLPTDDWTYDDITRAAQRLTKRVGAEVDVWGGGRNFRGDFSFMAVTRPFGGDLYTPDGKKTLIGSEGSRRAISWWLDRYLKDRSVALDPGTSNPRELLEKGKAAFAMGYNPGDRIRVANALSQAGAPWGLSLMPKGPSGRRGGAFFLSAIGMAKSTKVADEAWEFQKFLAEKETGIVMGFPEALSGQTSSHFGARKDIYSDPRVLNAPNMPAGVMAALARSMDLPEPLGFAANFLAAEVEKVVNDEVAKAIRGEVQYDGGFFQNLTNQTQAILDKPAPGPAR